MGYLVDQARGMLGKPDSVELWAGIVAEIPDAILLKDGVKILCFAVGHGTEADVIAKRMLKLGRTVKEVKNAIVVLDKYSEFTNLAKQKGYTNVVLADFIEWETDMKFDVIVGNPPFQDVGGQNTLYPKFYKKSVSLLNDNGCIGMITPPKIIPGLWGLKNPDGIKMPEPLNIEKIATGNNVKDYFPGIGSDFCYFVASRTPVDNTKVNVVLDAGSIVANSPLLVTNVDSEKLQIAQSIINKAFKFNKDPYNATTGDHGKSAKADANGKDLVLETISSDGTIKTRPATWLKKEHAHYGSPKVLMPLYGKVSHIDYTHKLVSAAQEKTANGKLTGHNICTVLTNSDSESESLVTILESSMQIFFNGVTNETRSQYVNFLKHFAGAPLTKKWTNRELYKHFNLTQDEMDYIESYVK